MPEACPRLLVNGYAETHYNIVEFGDRLYAAHQEDGEFEISRIVAGRTKAPFESRAQVSKTISRRIGGKVRASQLEQVDAIAFQQLDQKVRVPRRDCLMFAAGNQLLQSIRARGIE